MGHGTVSDAGTWVRGLFCVTRDQNISVDIAAVAVAVAVAAVAIATVAITASIRASSSLKRSTVVGKLGQAEAKAEISASSSRW